MPTVPIGGVSPDSIFYSTNMNETWFNTNMVAQLRARPLPLTCCESVSAGMGAFPYHCHMLTVLRHLTALVHQFEELGDDSHPRLAVALAFGDQVRANVDSIANESLS